MKPETRRLLILDVIVLIACVLHFFKGVSPAMFYPVLISKFVLLGYGIYLLNRMWGKGQLPE